MGLGELKRREEPNQRASPKVSVIKSGLPYSLKILESPGNEKKIPGPGKALNLGHGPWKSWKVLETRKKNSRPWKVLEFGLWSLKVLEIDIKL